ncbi:scavenger receptor cysteine-rich domain-containing protein DMBT1 isoform X2 [Danio rerio]|uniref:Soluble scavenger receptor cysteine-rich domain-containing protein SSC5D n=3 Tax=Danio rerio TaxID=7955 RepID=A0AB32TN49_DANRE
MSGSVWLISFLILGKAMPSTCETIRLMNGKNSCSGRVEVFFYDQYKNAQWGTVCDDGWSLSDAAVVCREMGCGDAIEAKSNAFFGEGVGIVYLSSVTCSGNEASLSNCGSKTMGEFYCAHSRDAGVVCNSLVRLANGTNPCSGRVEVLNDGQWGTVCSDGWDLSDAAVICKEMGCGSVSGSKTGAYFGQGSGPVWLSDVQCSNSESTLRQCALNGWGQNSCGHEKDAGVACQSKLRLANNWNSCSGRVEIYYNQWGYSQWGTVCDNGWNLPDAAVLCRDVGCGDAAAAKGAAYFGPGGGPVWLDNMNCIGNESTITAFLVRLVKGPNSCSGRVEVFFDGQWGTVCDDNWDQSDAAAVCSELGCGSVIEAKSAAYFGQGSGPVWLSGVKCATGSTLRNCDSQGWGQNSCGHERDAGVTCQPKMRLASGDGSCSGRVEVFLHSQWATVYDDGWDLSDAAVVCREMGCGDAAQAKSNAYFGQGTGQTYMSNVNCVGNESSLSVCESLKPKTTDHSKDAGVICDSPVRLINGNNSCSGRVEVFYSGQWGTVCGDGWDLTDAAVLCKDLGCGDAIEVKNDHYFGQGSGPVWLSNLQCSSTDTRLRDCKSSGWRINSCGHEKDAGVICHDNVRLVNGFNPCSGRVEVLLNGQWGTVCDDGWDEADAAVVCKRLGCRSVLEIKKAAYFGQGSGTVWMNNVSCFGDESALTSCSYTRSPTSCGHEKDAGVICGYFNIFLRIEVKAVAGLDPNTAAIMNKLSAEIGTKVPIPVNGTLITQADGKVFHERKKTAP